MLPPIGLKIIDIAFEDEGSIMVVTHARPWWQFWRPRLVVQRFQGEKIA